MYNLEATRPSYLENEALEYGEPSHKSSMHCEHDIIDLYRVDASRMALEVLVLDDGREEQAEVEGGVRQEPSDVESEEVKTQSNYTSPVAVEEYL